jgi:prepilin-type N-terminal cleavage/methylation domain-containing protein
MTTAHQGFTLIELAIVIAIIAILSGVAIQRIAGLVGGAEYALAINFGKTLSSSSATYMAKTGSPPSGYDDFVTTDVNAVNTATYTVALPSNSQGQPLCDPPSTNQIVCNGYETLTVTYTLAGGITDTVVTDK